MTYYLFVKDSFLGHVRGDLITNTDEVRSILSTDHRRFVTRVVLTKTSES